jgi:hypothetical protein
MLDEIITAVGFQLLFYLVKALPWLIQTGLLVLIWRKL